MKKKCLSAEEFNELGLNPKKYILDYAESLSDTKMN